MVRLAFTLLAALAAIPSLVAAGQDNLSARLIVTALDPDRGVLPGASVRVTATADIDGTAGRTGTTDARGVTTFEVLAPARYSIAVTLPGFDAGILRDVTLRAGDNRHAVVLPLRRVTEAVSVGGGQEGASSRSATTFGAAVSREAIDTLSDDAREAERQLLELAGPDAVIRVDSFEGAQLPPKSQIKSVHVTRDQFAAEADYPGTTFVDVITQPGTGALSGSGTMNARTMAAAGRSPFVSTVPVERNNNFSANIGGTLIPNRSDFSVSIQVRREAVTPIVRAAGQPGQVLNVRQPFEEVLVNGLLNYELPRNQTIRLGYANLHQYQRNLGVGNYDSGERAYDVDYTGWRVMAQSAGPLGRRTFINTRLQVTTTDEVRRSRLEARTIVIQGTKTTGGAQVSGLTERTNAAFASDVDYIRGIHSWRAGVQVNADWFDTNAASNYLGTYVFEDETAFLAGWPLLFTQTLGDPRVTYFNANTALYVQDDVRMRKSLTISPGVRYMLQTHVNDWRGIAPRFGVTWSPFASGRTTFRTSVGLFYWPMEMTRVYEQTLRVNGERQREALVVNPRYPDPGAVQGAAPNKYVLGDYDLQRNLRYSGGVEHSFTPRIRGNVLYAFTHQFALWRGLNRNAPVEGVRPDPTFANVIEAVTDGQVRRHDVSANLNVSMNPSSGGGQARFNWRRLALSAGYTLLHGYQNSEGPFIVPPSGTLETEWGRMPGDSPYRVNLQITSTQLRNLNATLTWTANAGSLYTVTSGLDDNVDGLLNDRPVGIAPRSLRGSGQATLNLRAAYTVMTAPVQGRRYRIGLSMNAVNLTNRFNYGGYSGNMLSPDFMQPTFVSNPRRIDVGVNVGF